ncbi:receptor-like protein 43 [Camellia sinensis]|uniref:receptor-like protein 43 n=1 Tax=Camellia sinensis TaxID=4442 RepID=UPI001035C2E2|nr:receptor-like protein 43 [Camellia sinensis]
MTQLLVLDVSSNVLTGPIPQSISKLVNLVNLNLSYNNFSGVELHVFLNLKKLELLDLSSNNLSVRAGPLSVPPLAVSYFFISQNKLIGDIPLSICNSSSLKILDLSHNNMSGVIPQCLGNSTLSVLDLRVNGFHGTIPTFANGELPRSLANCRHMEILDLGNNKLNDTFPYWLDSLPKLQVLILKSNRFHGPINSSRTIDPFCMLRIIDISHNEFTGFLPARYLQNFKAMRNVDGNTMTLKYMGQNYCRDSVKIVIKGLNIELLNILYFFTAIDFSDNKFKGAIPNVIGRLQALRLLNLSHNCLTSHIPSSMGNLSMLESLDLSSNQLYGGDTRATHKSNISCSPKPFKEPSSWAYTSRQTI